MHPHRSSALGYASAASAAHSRVYGACAAEAAASETSGLSVGGCPERWADFRPYPVAIFSHFTRAPSQGSPRSANGNAPMPQEPSRKSVSLAPVSLSRPARPAGVCECPHLGAPPASNRIRKSSVAGVDKKRKIDIYIYIYISSTYGRVSK